MTFTRVDITPDTPEWEEERRASVGASEVAAVMGLSPYATPLDVYKSKHGVDREFDPLLAFIGHESETIIAKWVEQYSGVDVTLEPAFMARSIEWPFLHASFDRVSSDPFTTWQFKTAHHYTGHKWDEGIPTDIRVQVQAEMAVAGTQRAAVVVWIGGREFRLFWEPRDDRFIREHMIPAVMEFWCDRVSAGVPPMPSTLAENAERFPTEPGKEIEASEMAMEAVDRRSVLLSDMQAMKAEADALQLVIANYMEDADTLTFEGRRVLTYKTQAGRPSFDGKRFKEDHPDLAAEYTRQGAPFRVMRITKEKK
ncbi:lambda-exonuclease family protein [Nesterenkonia sp.]|uniref:YqaJ viral recombinase family nuclease n=1 Tax=Nesterenkonia sp. TaxID=704201 RepID=UPI0026042A18|nr:YqaJ viral recombinase family protein [Nesterenkonia sp.]